MRLPLLVIGITLVCSGSAAAQTAGPARGIAPEFPASEFTLLNVRQRGDRLTAAALALAREPDTTATLTRLIEADRIDDALGVATACLADSRADEPVDHLSAADRRAPRAGAGFAQFTIDA